MKKNIIFLLILFVINCGTANKAVNEKPVPEYLQNKIFSNWSLYSYGLYYKSINEYSKAIKYFMDAAVYRKELHRIYYQISDCYYFLNNYDTAINFSEMAIEADKTYDKPYMLLNKIYLNLNNNKKAIEILEHLVENRPDMVSAHNSIGLLYYEMKDYDKALVSFRNILELSNVFPVEEYYKENANYYIARIYYNMNLIDRSIEYLEATVEINPGNKLALYLLSNICMEVYKLEEAKKYSLQYISRFESNSIINANIGRIYYIEDDMKALPFLRSAMNYKGIYGELSKSLYFELMHRDGEAEPLLRTIISGNPVLITPHIALAKISLRKNDNKTALNEFFTAAVMAYKAVQYSTAKSLFAKAMSVNDQIPEVYFYLGKIYEETQKINLAVYYFKKTNKLKPDYEIQIHIGYLYSLLNDFDDAMYFIDSAIKQEPNNSKPYFFKGLALSRRNDFTEAEALFKKAIELNNSDDTYYFYLATVQEKQNKIEDTIKSLKQAIEHNPDNSMVYNYLGYFYVENNMNLDESIELIKKALALSPSNGAYLDSLGWAYYKKGDLKLALKKLLQAERELDKDKSPDPIVYDHIGDAYNKIGDSDKAREYWGKSLNLGKNSRIEEKIETNIKEKTKENRVK